MSSPKNPKKNQQSPKASAKYTAAGEGKKQLSEEQREDIKVAFDLFDKDGSGSITREEFSDAMRALGFEGSREEVNAMIAHADHSTDEGGGGELDFEEFLRLMQDKLLNYEPKDDIERVFKIFMGKDGTRTGYIDGSDIKREASELGDPYTTEQWDSLVDLVSLGRGHLELEDWMRIMKKHNLY